MGLRVNALFIAAHAYRNALPDISAWEKLGHNSLGLTIVRISIDAKTYGRYADIRSVRAMHFVSGAAFLFSSNNSVLGMPRQKE